MQKALRLSVIGLVCSCLALPAAAQWGNPNAAPLAAGSGAVGLPVGQSGMAAPAEKNTAPESFWDIVKSGGIVGLLIFLLSIVAVALAIEHIMTIRASVLMPHGLSEEVRQLLAGGNVAAAEERCGRQPSFLAFVLSAGLAEIEGGWSAVEKALEDATADQSARLLRKIEYLSVIGNIAPMLGLLGTVIGMIFAFHKVADTQGAAQPADLATGIYLALITTVEGLIVAIPTLGAFAIFRNRVDQFVAEAAYAALHAFGPLKRGTLRRHSGGSPPSGAAPPVPPIPPRGGRG